MLRCISLSNLSAVIAVALITISFYVFFDLCWFYLLS